jgi:short-subunit dehydrogenase
MAAMKKTIFITGAGSGFGRDAALGLARQGHDVIAGTQISPQVTELRERAKKENLKLRVEKVDTLNPIDREFALKWDIDVLVNNAAIGEAGPLAEIPIQLFRDVFETNVFAALELTQGFVKKMVKKGKGKVIFVSSVAGLATVPFVGTYAASKHALEAIAEAMHEELAPHGVKVVTLEPGPYNTGFNDRLADTMWRWFDPKVNFTSTEPLKALNTVLANQLDPKDLVDTMIDLIVADESKFRNVHPKETEDDAKEVQKKAWTLAS